MSLTTLLKKSLSVVSTRLLGSAKLIVRAFDRNDINGFSLELMKRTNMLNFICFRNNAMNALLPSSVTHVSFYSQKDRIESYNNTRQCSLKLYQLFSMTLSIIVIGVAPIYQPTCKLKRYI